MSPIVWELALVVGAVAAFAIWQFRTLARDQAITRREREERERAEREGLGQERAQGAGEPGGAQAGPGETDDTSDRSTLQEPTRHAGAPGRPTDRPR
jgi:hypothetical protein